MSKVWDGGLSNPSGNSLCSAESLISTLPAAISGNKTFGALARALSKQLIQIDRLIENVLIFPRIDMLSEQMLDILAYDMHVDWYDYDADIAIKRVILKNSVAVHKHLGTIWAVKKVITDYFGAGTVKEWMEYGGEPHHFKVISGNAAMVGENLDAFLAMLEHVKRKSSWLDSVQIGLTGETTVFVGIAYRECSHEVYDLRGEAIDFGQAG